MININFKLWSKFEFYFLPKRISSNSIMLNKKMIQSIYKWQTKNHFISHVFNKDRMNLETDITMTNMSIIQFIFNLHLTTISINQFFSWFFKIFWRNQMKDWFLLMVVKWRLNMNWIMLMFGYNSSFLTISF